MAHKLQTIIKALEKFDSERIFWLKLSAFVVLVILFSIFEWSLIQRYDLGWYVFAAGTTISVIWWYWTMRLIRATLSHRQEEVKVLIDLVEDIKAIKQQVNDLNK